MTVHYIPGLIATAIVREVFRRDVLASTRCWINQIFEKKEYEGRYLAEQQINLLEKRFFFK